MKEIEIKGIQIGKKVLSLFGNDIILYTENPKDATRQLLEFINKFGKVAGYKINTPKAVAFLYTNDKRSEITIRKQSHFYHCIRKNKIPRNNLSKEAKDLYFENFKTLMREIKEDTNRWKDILCSWIGRINTVKRSYNPRQSTGFNAIPIKLPMQFFTELEQKKFF